jgi:arginine/lysine/ornithine decarboxylase
VAHPAGVRGRQPAYEKIGLRDLCQQIHDFYKAYDVAA